MSGRRECECETPRPSVDPRRPDTCLACSLWINPAWTTNDETTRAFYDRLALTIPGWPEVPDSFKAFRRLCEQREREIGRPTYGLAFLAGDNPAGAVEEAADFANYMLFDVLQARRNGIADEDIDTALMGAWHMYRGFCCALELRAKRRHTP